LYYVSVGRGANLLLNIGPDRRSQLPDEDTRRLLEFGREIERRFNNPFATRTDCVLDENRWIYRSDQTFRCDHAVIAEDIAQGERILRFAIRARMHSNQKPITVFEGRFVGAQAICPFPTIRAREIWLEVLDTDGAPQLARLDFLYAKSDA